MQAGACLSIEQDSSAQCMRELYFVVDVRASSRQVCEEKLTRAQLIEALSVPDPSTSLQTRARSIAGSIDTASGRTGTGR